MNYALVARPVRLQFVDVVPGRNELRPYKLIR